MHCIITVNLIINVGSSMCEKEEGCEFEDDLKGCTLKHIGKARSLISEGRFEGADLELSYAENHLKDT